MKPRQFRIIPLAILFAGSSANAAPLTWDAGNIANGATIDAASGTWDLAATNWNNAGANVAWTQTSGTVALNSAIFAGADGSYVIDVTAPLATSALTFSNDGYTLSATSAQIITNTGTTLAMTIANTKTATIGANVKINAATSTITGGGTLKITGTGSIYNASAATSITTATGVGLTTVEVGTGGSLVGGGSIFAGTSSAGGTLKVNGGTVSVVNNASNNLTIGNAVTAGVGRVTLTSGSITLSNVVGSGLRYGSLTQSTGAATGSFDLDGGTLTTASIYKNAANTNVVANFNFNGGALKANVANASFMTTAINSIVKTGGAKIDTNNFAISIASVLTHDTALGATADGGLTKSNTGTLTLTGANTYTGATTITGGTLALGTTGSINTSPTIIVGASTTFDVSAVTGGYTLASTQTLSGTGTVAGSATIAGTLSPGNSPGTLAVGNQTWMNGGDYNWQMLDATGVAGTGFDTIAMTGTLDLSSVGLTAGGFAINLWSLASIVPDANGDATNFNNTLTQSWNLLTASAGITGFDAADFVINVGANNGTSGFSNALGGGAFSLGTSGNNLVLNFTAVPEPNAAMLVGGLGVFALLRRRRA